MGFWAWFLIWSALIVLTLAGFAQVLYSLYQKGIALQKVVEPLLPKLEALQRATERSQPTEQPESALLSDPVEQMKLRLTILRRKQKKRDAKEHMLINRLKRSRD